MITPAHLQALCERLCEAARKETLNQSILFVGKEGVGKFSLVMNVARVLLCENDMSACGKCQSCREVERLSHPDFLLLFPFPNLRPESRKQTVFHFSDPVASNARFSDETREAVEEFRQAKLVDPFALPNFEKKENIPVEVVKDLLRALSKKPLRGRRVVAVLDIEKMAFGATDLFLKTVEEPPRNTHLLLTTSQPDLLYPTLLSRTQRIKVPLVPEDQIMKILGERSNLDPGRSRYLARMAGGSLGAALNLVEADVASRREKVLELFMKVFEEGELNSLLRDVGSRYSGFKARYDDVRLDFDIIESLIHDLHLIADNNLDNDLINIDIKRELQKLKAPEREVLEIWSECCAQVRRACTVNNVSADACMAFFYVSCSQAMRGLTKPKYTLP